MRKTIVVNGKKLVYSPKYHGYIDPEWHPGVRGSAIYEQPTVWKFKKTQRRVKKHTIIAMFYSRMDRSTKKPPALIRLGRVAVDYLIRDTMACITSLITSITASVSSHFWREVIRGVARLELCTLVSLRAERPCQKPTRYSYPSWC